jgi:hypothetical protein
VPLSLMGAQPLDTLDVVSGTLSCGMDFGATSPNLAVTIATGAAALFNCTQRIGSLNVNGLATIGSGGGKVLMVKDLAVAGRLDLGDNDLLVDYAGDSPAGTFAGGTWAGNGIVTSASAAQPATRLTTLGAGEIAQSLHLLAGQTALYQGVTVDDTTVLVKYTYEGDADLNGRLDGDDYFILDQNLAAATPSPGWQRGDFTYDGTLNGDDYFELDRAIGLLDGAL